MLESWDRWISECMNNLRSPVHTIFLAELSVRQPFVARWEVEQVPKKG